MFRTVFLCTVIQVLALRGAEQVASLIEDQYADDAPVVKPSKVHNDSSFTELSVEPVDSSESPEADPLKTALPKKESTPLELLTCSNGTLQLESGTYEVTQTLQIPCNVNSNGATLLLSAPLFFSKTARFEGKLSVKGSGSLFGPCFLFLKDAFIQSSAEMRFVDCHNVVENIGGGAIYVGGNLTVTGNVSIHNCSADYGGGIYVNEDFIHSGGAFQISGSSAQKNGGGIYVKQSFTNAGGEIQISGSSAQQSGGGIYVEHNFTNSGEIQISGSSAEDYGGGICVEKSFANSGEIQISGSSAKYNGGGIYVEKSFANSGGRIKVSGSSANDSGGGMFVIESFIHSGGKIQISGSSAKKYGGGIFVQRSFTNSGGRIEVSSSSTKQHGGGIYVNDNFVHSGGNLSISGSLADWHGGGIYVYRNFTNWGGKIQISGSSAKNHGGGIYVNESFIHARGKIQISGSSAKKSGGGIFVLRSFTSSGGRIEVSNSSAAKEHGGGIFVQRSFTRIEVSNSSAKEHGGGIYVNEDFIHSGGTIQISGSSAQKNGGGIYVQQSFTNSGGEIQISASLSEVNGGGIYVHGNCTNWGGKIQISGSSAKKHGGGISVEGSFIHSGGNLSISGSSANARGGGIYVHRNFKHLEGKIEISGSSANARGGGIYVHRNFIHSGGNLSISGSSADWAGGIYLQHNFTSSGGEIHVSGSSAKKVGGGIYVMKNFINSGGSLSVSNSSSKGFGGCLYVQGNAVFVNAMASFSQCHAERDGGGILTPISNVSLTNSSSIFKLATAGGRGAAVLASHLEQTGGDMMVYNSSASGEVIAVTAAWSIDSGAFQLHHCKADGFLITATAGATLNASTFVVSHASAAGMLLSSGEVTMSNGVFNQASSPQLRANVVKVTHLNVTGSEASISWASGISANESTVHDMDCDDSFGGYNRTDGVGCTKCDPGSVFVKNILEKTIANRSAVQHCVPCPDGAKICNATDIEMQLGMMVGQNISRGFHCPNPLACPGANISVNTNTSPCEKGYEGVGCAKCTNDHARSNSNVFVCLRCAEGWWRVKDVFLFLASDAVIFIISAAGVVSAGRQNKNSKVYLNQLMAFAAVTAPALLALRSTITFVSLEHQLKSLRQLIPFVSTPVQVGNAGESANAVSTECILRYLGMEPSLASAHFLSSVLYIMLTLSLAAKSGMSVAVVVGINCFLPRFCAAFGSYLICFKMEPFGESHCLMGSNWLGATMRTVAVLSILSCFIAGPGLWITMTRDKNLSDKPEVLFLTRSYRKGFETWEVERLVRRMVLKIIGSTIPISVNPFGQMAWVSVVLVASLFLHAKQAPYAKDEWNEIERGLLVTALIIVILTTWCLANARHWAPDQDGGKVVFLAIIVTVGVAGFFQSFLLIRELIRERRPQPVNTPEPMESIEPTEGEDGEVSKG